MKQILVHGFSDDIIHVQGGLGDHEYAARNQIIRGQNGEVLASYAGRLILSAQYSELVIHCLYDGCWSFACSRGDAEDIDVFAWNIRYEWGRCASYSDTLIVTCPDDTRIAWKGAD
jgi:hypothetical protein